MHSYYSIIVVVELRVNKSATGITSPLRNHCTNVPTHSESVIICSLTAGSNITGITANFDVICEMVHQYGGYVFWDYATAAPYVEIDMNRPGLAYKDAVFISMHKFIGGVSCPGLLVMNRSMLMQSDVSSDTSAMGIIRTALAFKLKHMAQFPASSVFAEHFAGSSVLHIMGDLKSEGRLPIFSFLIRHAGSHRLVHHNFIGRLLNDLFGIQTRTGCVCSAPYTQDLLDLYEHMLAQHFSNYQHRRVSSIELSHEHKDATAACPAQAISKPGFCRINIAYFLKPKRVHQIIRALDFVSQHGWKFLPQYSFDALTGSWTHRSEADMDLSKVCTIMVDDDANTRNAESIDKIDTSKLLADAITKAGEITFDLNSDNVSDDSLSYNWFLSPKKAAAILVNMNS